MNNSIPAFRSKPSDTRTNRDRLLQALADPTCVFLCLFATVPTINDTFSQSDGPNTNLPFIVALASFKVLDEHVVNVVLDGMQLTAVRLPRYYEVKQLLDAASGNKKAFFNPVPVNFTSQISPEEAAHALLSHATPIPLTNANRSQFFSLLSNISEVRLQSY